MSLQGLRQVYHRLNTHLQAGCGGKDGTRAWSCVVFFLLPFVMDT